MTMQLCQMFIDKMNYSPNVAKFLTLHVYKNGKCMYARQSEMQVLTVHLAVKSLSPTDKPLDLQKKLIAAKVKWNDQQKKNYFMFQLNDAGAKRMSMVCTK